MRWRRGDCGLPSPRHCSRPSGHEQAPRQTGAETLPAVAVLNLGPGESAQVAVGDHAEEGVVLGACENSGNSTQPHLHIQATIAPTGSRREDYPARSGPRVRPRYAERLSSSWFDQARC